MKLSMNVLVAELGISNVHVCLKPNNETEQQTRAIQCRPSVRQCKRANETEQECVECRVTTSNKWYQESIHYAQHRGICTTGALYLFSIYLTPWGRQTLK